MLANRAGHQQPPICGFERALGIADGPLGFRENGETKCNTGLATSLSENL